MFFLILFHQNKLGVREVCFELCGVFCVADDGIKAPQSAKAEGKMRDQLFLVIKTNALLRVFQHRARTARKDLRYRKSSIVCDPSGGKEGDVKGKAFQGVRSHRAAKHCGVAKLSAGHEASDTLLTQINGKLEIGGNDDQALLF